MTRTITVSALARVEGEGALDLVIENGQVQTANLRIYEPPRFFEAFLRGRHVNELPDIVARICGICPVAYQMGAVHAIEQAFGINVGGQLRALRRLLYCGEWIESHALHVAMLHAPDFLGVPDAIALAATHGDLVRAALQLKKTGNEIMRVLGGREIHPVSVRVGGFHRVPTPAELAPLLPQLRTASEHAATMLRWVSGFDFPDFDRDYEFVALRHASEYPLNEGRLVSTRGLDIPIEAFEAEFEEIHVRHSNALHAARRHGGAYLVGPLARYALNFDRLPPHIQDMARAAGLGPVCRNPFKAIIVRCVELLYACHEAARIITAYEKPDQAAVPAAPLAGEGFGCTEAPRGICWHHYRTDADGLIRSARIVPPTSQNQPSIEADLRDLAQSLVDADDDTLRHRCEQAIRNHDPCISCATHFLKLHVTRR